MGREKMGLRDYTFSVIIQDLDQPVKPLSMYSTVIFCSLQWFCFSRGVAQVYSEISSACF